MLEALLLGEDGRLDEATVENLQQTGLYHLFAISGGHIAIINVLLFSLFRFVRMSRRASSLALAVFLVFYTVLVEGSPSVLRATLMTLAFLAGRLLWKDVHVLNTIAASAFVLLLANPSSLFDIGFQLTYAATLTIILFTPPLLQRLPRLPLKISELAGLSVTAALWASRPLIARSFNRVAFSSLLLNFAGHPSRRADHGRRLRLPAVRRRLSRRGRPCRPRCSRILVGLFARISHSLDAFPFLSIRVPTPPAWLLCGYYLTLGSRPGPAALPGSSVPSLLGDASWLFSALLVVAPFRPASPDLRITMIDVGQGESVLVEFPGRRTMLIDGGGLAGSPFDVGERVVSPGPVAQGHPPDRSPGPDPSPPRPPRRPRRRGPELPRSANSGRGRRRRAEGLYARAPAGAAAADRPAPLSAAAQASPWGPCRSTSSTRRPPRTTPPRPRRRTSVRS